MDIPLLPMNNHVVVIRFAEEQGIDYYGDGDVYSLVNILRVDNGESITFITRDGKHRLEVCSGKTIDKDAMFGISEMSATKIIWKK